MKQELYEALGGFIKQNDEFRIGEQAAITPDMAGLVPFDAPLIGICDANDDWFRVFQQEGVVGAHHRKPKDWLSDATRVVSVFMPKSETVRVSNRGGDWPSLPWLHARYEGQQAIGKMAAYVCTYLQGLGYDAVAPMLDKGYKTGHDGNAFTSNWSERHVAYACNLGTFSLSRGLITQKGVTGRFFSIVTNAPLPLDSRQTREREAACAHCGACIAACPVGAISFENGKDHPKCSAFLDVVRDKERPRYGCGKCQAGMPCEAGTPCGL